MKKYPFFILAIACLVILLFTFLQSYTLSDDVLYRCIWRRSETEDFVPIRNFYDIIQSQIIHYQILTGRAIVQTVAQTILGLFNKNIYNILNTIVFGMTAWFATKYATCNKITCVSILMIIFIMMVMIPGFVDDYIWIEGSINYLWVSLAILLFIFIFERKIKAHATLKDYFISPLTLFIGWTHEGIALPLAISLCILCWLRRNKIAHNAAIPYIVWFTIGALICSFSPSTILRAIGGEGHKTVSIGLKFALGIFTLTEMRTLWILVLVCAYTYKFKNRLFKFHLRRYIHIYFSILFCIAIIFASGVTQPRVCYFTEFFSMLLVVNFLHRLGIEKYERILNTTMIIIIVLIITPGIYYSYIGYCNYKYIKSQINNNNSEIIGVKPLIGNTYFIRKFTFNQVEFGPNTNYFAPDSTDENVRCAATLLGKKRLVFLPDDMLHNIMHNPNSYQKYSENIAGEMIAMQIPKGTKVNKITFILGEDNPPLYKRPFMFHGYSYEAKRWQVIEINGRFFVFFDKPIPKISRRIKDIRIS